MPSVLIVCTANICRSPMAEAILKKLVSELPDANRWQIDSAGTWALDGSPPAFLSQYVMEKMGLDISAHQSQPVSSKLLQNFDLVLTMENRHKKSMQKDYPSFSARIYMISEMADEQTDIPDPIGGDLSDYLNTADMLQKFLTVGFDRIIKLASMNEQEV